MHFFCLFGADLIVVVASVIVLSVGSNGQVFATSAIRYHQSYHHINREQNYGKMKPWKAFIPFPFYKTSCNSDMLKLERSVCKY